MMSKHTLRCRLCREGQKSDHGNSTDMQYTAKTLLEMLQRASSSSHSLEEEINFHRRAQGVRESCNNQRQVCNFVSKSEGHGIECDDRCQDHDEMVYYPGLISEFNCPTLSLYREIFSILQCHDQEISNNQTQGHQWGCDDEREGHGHKQKLSCDRLSPSQEQTLSCDRLSPSQEQTLSCERLSPSQEQTLSCDRLSPSHKEESDSLSPNHDHTVLCESCFQKGKQIVASSFCYECNARMCANHGEFHRDFLATASHEVISIGEYLAGSERFDHRPCPKHPKFDLDGVCLKCRVLNCVACRSFIAGMVVSFASECTQGGKHESIQLIQLVKMMQQTLGEMDESVKLIQQNARDALKAAHVTVTTSTQQIDDMVLTIKQTFQEQVQALKALYQDLEDKLVRVKEENMRLKEKYSEELEKRLKRVTELYQTLGKLLSSGHPADIAKHGTSVCHQLLEEISNGVPELRLSCVRLARTGEWRQIELELQCAVDVCTDHLYDVSAEHSYDVSTPLLSCKLPQELTSHPASAWIKPAAQTAVGHISHTCVAEHNMDEFNCSPKPSLLDALAPTENCALRKSAWQQAQQRRGQWNDPDRLLGQRVPPEMVIIKALSAEQRFYSVCHIRGGRIMAGSEDCVELREPDGALITTITMTGWFVSGVACLGDLLYTVLKSSELLGPRMELRAYKSTGELHYHWTLPDSDFFTNVAVFKDCLLFPDPHHAQVLMYSSSGLLVRTIKTHGLELPSRIGVSEEFVVVSDCRNHKVAAFSTRNWEVQWVYQGLKGPTAAAVEQSGRVWVPSHKEPCIHVIGSDGQLISMLEDERLRNCCGVSIYRGQLLAATWAGDTGLLIYKI